MEQVQVENRHYNNTKYHLNTIYITIGGIKKCLRSPFQGPQNTFGGSSVCPQCGKPRFDPWVGKILWRRKWQPTPVFLPGESHGGRSLVGYSPRGCKKSDTTELLHKANVDSLRKLWNQGLNSLARRFHKVPECYLVVLLQILRYVRISTEPYRDGNKQQHLLGKHKTAYLTCFFFCLYSPSQLKNEIARVYRIPDQKLLILRQNIVYDIYIFY